MNPRHCLLAFASAVALLPAQDQGAFRFALADSIAVVRLAAPAKWQQQFATTQVVKLLASDKLAPMVGAVSQGIEQGLGALRQSGAFDADLLEKLLADYKGDVVVAASLDVDSMMQAITSGETPSFGVTVALTADGSYDLGKLAAELQKSIEKEVGKDLRDLQVGDHRLRCTKNEGEPDVVLPAMVDGHLVLMVSNDVEKFAAKVLGKGPRFAGGSGEGTMFAHVELAPLMKAVGEAAAAASETPFDVGALLDAVGLGCLGSMNGSLGATGKHLTAEATIQFLEKERGLFRLLGKGDGTPKLMRLVPPDADTWSVTPVDFGALHGVVANIWSVVGDSAPMTWEQSQAAFAENLKVRLKEDLLDHLGGELLMLQDLQTSVANAAVEDEDDPMAGLNGMCAGIALRDGKAFGEAIEKMLRARGLHASRKTEDYAATKVHRLRLAGLLDLEYAITDDLLLLGIGSSPASQKALRSVLDARSNPAAAGEAPPAVKDAVAGLPAGWTGISVMSVDGWLRGFADGFVRGFAATSGTELPPEVEQMLDALKGVGGELGRFGLQTMVSTTRMDAASMRSSIRW